MDKLSELRAAITERQARIDELANAEDITPEQDATLTDEIAAQRADVAELERLEKRDAEIGEIRAKATGFVPGVAPSFIKPVDRYGYDLRTMPTHGEVRDATMRVLEDDSVARYAPKGAQEAIERLVSVNVDNKGHDPSLAARHFLATMRPEYVRGFAKLVTGYHLDADEARALNEARAWSNSSDSTVIPELFDPQLVLASAGAVNPFRQIGTIKTGTADVWEGLYTGGVAASWDGEAVEVSDDDPSFTRPTITAYKGATFVPFSVEFQGDGAAVVAELATLFADAKDRLESTAFATGNGSSAPKGVITALDASTYAEITPTTDGQFGVEDLYKMMNNLSPRWRANASWVTSMNVANRVRGFGTALGHAYTTDLTGSYNFAPLGRPLYESSDYPAPTSLTTGSQNLLTFGDHSKYFIYDRIGLAVEYIPHLFSTGNGLPKGQRGVYGWWRTGADVMANGTTPPILLLQNA